MEQTINNLISQWLAQTRVEKGSPLLVILGPTASGKTALSLEVAEKFGGEIVSADSRQVYRHMDIGTDKISVDARRGIPHYLLDVADPSERFTVADFKTMAEAAIDDILACGKLPMLVGGTGLYVRAITENFSLPPENPKVRAQLMSELGKVGSEGLHKKLVELDPANASKIHPRNTPYIVRALEILMTTGNPKNDQRGEPKYRCLAVGRRWPKEELFTRIAARVDEQIERGLLEETKKLLAMGYSKNLASMNSLGYKEIIAHLDGEISLEEACELLKKNTRNFAKRQMTWFKKEKNVRWLDMIS